MVGCRAGPCLKVTLRPAGVQRNTAIRVTILHTNDMHGRAEAMARLSHLARRRRAEAKARGEAVFFWDAGDPLDRQFRACSLTKGAALARVLNAMDYSLMTMGNDILLTYGPQAMAEVAGRLAFPVLAANCRDGTGPLSPGLKESALLDIPGAVRIGVVGLTAPWGGLYESFGLRFPDTFETARSVVAALRRDGATVIVALSHLGLADDKLLAESVPGIDLVIGAHSHDMLPEGIEHAGVLIVQAGWYAEALGTVEIELDTGSRRPIGMRAGIERVGEAEPADPAVVAALAEAEAEADGVAAQPVAELLEPLGLSHEAECPLGDLAADALRDRMGADMAIIISGQLAGGLAAGTVTFGALNDVSRVTANPQRARLRGAQIVAALERGVDPTLTSARPRGLRGTPIGWPQISGMSVEWDPDRPAGRRIRRVWVGTEPLQAERTYLLAHSDAETMKDFALIVLEPGENPETETPTVTREVLEDYLRLHSPVPAPSGGRWRRVAP